MRTRTAIYARYSCDKQRDASIEDQVEACSKYADEHGYEVVGTYCDYAMSGRSDDRPQFLRMIEDGQSQMFDVIVLWKLDRFARNMQDQYYYEHLLAKAGVIVESVMEHVTGSGIEATTNKAVTALFAQIRSQQSAEDTMRGMLGKARKCQYLGYPHFGYGHEGDEITLDEGEAEVVREVHERYLAGESVRDIGRWFMEGGHRSFGNLHAAEIYIGKMLKTDLYCGVYQWGKLRDDRGDVVLDELGRPRPLVRVEGGIPAIVSWETKHRVWERMRIRKKHARVEVYELTGKLYCSRCGKPLHGLMAYGKMGTPYRYYACKGKQTTCFGRVSKERLEGSVAAAVRAFVADDGARDYLTGILCDYRARHRSEETARALKNEARDVSRQIDNLVTAIQQGLPWEHARERMATLEAQRDGLERRRAALEAERRELDPEDVRAFLDAVGAGYASDAEILRAFVRKTWLFDGQAVATINLGGADASLREIEAKLEGMAAKPQAEGVRLSQRWCPR